MTRTMLRINGLVLRKSKFSQVNNCLHCGTDGNGRTVVDDLQAGATELSSNALSFPKGSFDSLVRGIRTGAFTA